MCLTPIASSARCGRGADRVVASHLLAADAVFNGQVLACLELELVAEVIGNVESDFDAVWGQGLDAFDRDRVGAGMARRGGTRHSDRQQRS